MKKDLIKIILSIILFAVAIVVKFENIWINNTIFILSYILVGFEVIKEAIENIIHGEVFDECFLMTIATIGAFAIGEFPEAVAVMLFYQIGEMFQDFAIDKSKESITKLMDIRPDYANILNDEEIEKVSPDIVKIGDIIIVKPGEKVPLDGIVLEGSSMVDTVALTGEAIPRKIKVGDEILSGCINKNEVLKIKVTKEFSESTVSKILDLVENSSSKKAKTESFITKFAKYYTPIVVVIAIFLAIIPPLVMQDWHTFSTWLYRALAFLVVSCPCALVISIPLSFFGGIGGAGRKGILIKGGNYIEALANTQIAVFDKTGTLTKGVFKIQKIENIGIEKQELLKYVAYAEHHSNHPIANAIKQSYGKEINNKLVAKTEEIAGYGIKSIVDNKEILVGNNKLMEQNKIKFSKSEDIGTILYVAIDGNYVGNILIADELKEDAQKTITNLNKNRVKTVMLTGDKKEIGEEVYKKLGMTQYYSELLPDEKVERVENLMKEKSEKGKLTFVGDGINDAPVLAISDVGCAMGALGSDAAIEAADVVFMTDEPSKLLEAIKIAKKTLRIAKENIVFAIAVKIVVLILSAIGIATMWMAVFADVGVSFIAVLNALRSLNS